MEHRFIVARMQRQIPDDGGHAKRVGSHYQTDNDHNKPLEGGTEERKLPLVGEFD